MFMKKSLYVIAFLFTLSSKTNAQAFADLRAQMVKDWERAKAYTIEYLNTMPTDKYSYKPNDSVRSFAGHMLHLATINAYLMFIASDQMPPSWLSRELQN